MKKSSCSESALNLGDKILKQCELTLERYRKKAIELGTQEFGGVGTQVFRECLNGKDFLSTAVGWSNVKIITQEKEGHLGYLTALSVAKPLGIFAFLILHILIFLWL